MLMWTPHLSDARLPTRQDASQDFAIPPVPPPSHEAQRGVWANRTDSSQPHSGFYPYHAPPSFSPDLFGTAGVSNFSNYPIDTAQDFFIPSTTNSTPPTIGTSLPAPDHPPNDAPVETASLLPPGGCGDSQSAQPPIQPPSFNVSLATPVQDIGQNEGQQVEEPSQERNNFNPSFAERGPCLGSLRDDLGVPPLFADSSQFAFDTATYDIGWNEEPSSLDDLFGDCIPFEENGDDQTPIASDSQAPTYVPVEISGLLPQEDRAAHSPSQSPANEEKDDDQNTLNSQVPNCARAETAALLPSEERVLDDRRVQSPLQSPPSGSPATPVQEGHVDQGEVQEIRASLSPEDFPRNTAADKGKGKAVSPPAVADPEDATVVHHCRDEKETICPGHGPICIDEVCKSYAKNPDKYSDEEILQLFIAALARPSHSASDSNSAASPSAPSCPPPGELCLPPPNNYIFVVEGPSSMGAAGPSKRKRKRAGAQQSRRTKPRLENGEMKQDDEDGCDGESDTTDDEEKLLEKKAADLGHFCVLCKIFKGVWNQFSRRDSCKRHIPVIHPMFAELVQDELEKKYDVLKRRSRSNESEDLRPLIKYCMDLQQKARQRGEVIKRDEDLMRRYPDVAEAMGFQVSKS